MKRIYYKKQGRRYVPVYEYDQELLDGLPKGAHLLMIKPGGSSTRYNIDPAYAPMIAAGQVAEDAICAAMHEASKLRPSHTPITPAQLRAWKQLAKEFGEEVCTLRGPSLRDITEAGVKAMQVEADKLLKHDSVRHAYEHFLLMCALAKAQDEQR